MEIVSREYRIYEFRELNEDAKQRVRDWYLDGQESFVFTQMVEEDMMILFPNSSLEVEYSLGYCQGDGLNLYGNIEVSDMLNFIQGDAAGDLPKDFKNVFSEKEIRTLKAYEKEGCVLRMPGNPHRYAYCYAPWAEPCDDWNEYLSCWRNINWTLINRFEKVVKEVFIRLCKQWEESGYEFFYEINDDDLRDICEINDYRFLEDGSYVCM